jgi:hypothetical protein
MTHLEFLTLFDSFTIWDKKTIQTQQIGETLGVKQPNS